MDVCFGATNQSAWTSFSFDHPVEISVFEVPFENKVPEQEGLFGRVYN